MLGPLGEWMVRVSHISERVPRLHHERRFKTSIYLTDSLTMQALALGLMVSVLSWAAAAIRALVGGKRGRLCLSRFCTPY